MIQIIFVTRAATYKKRVEEHKHSAIGKHFDDERDLRPLKLRTSFQFVLQMPEQACVPHF